MILKEVECYTSRYQSAIFQTGLSGPNSLGGRSSGPLGMAQQMMQNPETMREMMNSPIVQSILSNPDIIRSLIADNPQIQQVIEATFYLINELVIS